MHTTCNMYCACDCGLRIFAHLLHDPHQIQRVVADARVGSPQVALTLAARCGAPRSAIETLISMGADVNVSTQRDRQTPLHVAADYGHTATVEDLLELGADANASDMDGMVPIDYACTHGNDDMVALLECR